MPVNDDLGTRMKEFYESVPRFRLYRRQPVAIRIDGKAFHTFTRGFQKPFDSVLGNAMVRTMKYLCQNIQGCVFGYTQSDEITLILTDYKKFTSSAWFDYEIQKMCSIAASMATMAFNKFFKFEVENFEEYNTRDNDCGVPTWKTNEAEAQCAIYWNAIDRGAMFDARCFNIPKEEVCNLIYWRQLDATRNSIQMVGQANFSHKELQGCSCNTIQDMLLTQRDINWNNYPTRWKRGVACYKEDAEIPSQNGEGVRFTSNWCVDYDMPILKNDDRAYVDKHIFFGEGL